MTNLLIGTFATRADAEAAVNELESLGLNPKDVSVIMKDMDEAKSVAEGAPVADGIATGATTGVLLGGLAGLLIGIGAIALPGIGGIIVAGPIASALGLSTAAASTISGALTGGAAGGLVGGLVGLGLPEEEAQYYEGRVREGGILIAVPTSFGEGTQAKIILEKHNAEQVRAIQSA
ncbi:MAG: general stress protein [Candidatus Gracilibacteria bacterium]